jgi:hypothetical protein
LLAALQGANEQLLLSYKVEVTGTSALLHAIGLTHTRHAQLLQAAKDAVTTHSLSFIMQNNRTCSSSPTTSGCALSTSSNTTTLCGRRRMASVSSPPLPYPEQCACGSKPVVRLFSS